MPGAPHRDLATWEPPVAADDDVPLLGAVEVANCEPAASGFGPPVDLARVDGCAVRTTVGESHYRDRDGLGEGIRLQLVMCKMPSPHATPTMQVVRLGRDGGVRSVVSIAAGDISAVEDGLAAFIEAVKDHRQKSAATREAHSAKAPHEGAFKKGE